VKPEELLRGLRERTPAPRAGLTEAIMQQIALRPRPRRAGWWHTITRTRRISFEIRPARLLGVGALAVLMLMLMLHFRPPTGAPVRVATVVPAPSANVGAPEPILIRFALPAPNAQRVSLAGDFNGWRPDATPLVRDLDGVWRATVSLPAGTFSYSFVVDGKWVEDPFAESYRADGFGGRNALVHVGG